MELQKFFSEIKADDIILTANRRLGAYLQAAYDTWQVKAGKEAWYGLQIIPLQVWIEDFWNNVYMDNRVLLSDFQELQLWHECIENSEAAQELINLSKMASLAKETWKLIHHWLITLDDLETHANTDTQFFLALANEFTTRCKKYHVLSRHEVISHMLKMGALLKDLPLPPRILFVGFDDFSPAILGLQEFLKTSSTVLNIDLENCNHPVIHKVPCATKGEELCDLARWAYQTLVKFPHAKIGCIVPNLSQTRSHILQTFQDVFFADHFAMHLPTFPFNVSAGQPLNEFPIIDSALAILNLNCRNPIPLENVSALLLSPFIEGSIQEINKRAYVDVNIRAVGETKFLQHGLLQSKLLNDCPIFEKNLNQFNSMINFSVEQRSPEEWSNLFVAQLNLFGWPGERTLNSIEFQLIERFKKILTEFCALDFIYPVLTLGKALHLLVQLTELTIFQPKTEEKPIQVLGILEASGIAFDYLWVSGLDDESWPAPCNPNPFVPVDLQRKLNFPHSSANRELEFSQKVTTRFLQNANHIIFSYAQQEDDRQFNASPLISDFPSIELSFYPYSSIAKQIYQHKEIEEFVDDYGPVIKDEFVRGGTGIFKAQAACPFQAFAKFRLEAEPINTPEFGLAAYEKGLLMHEVLALFWKRIKNHKGLCALTVEALTLLLDEMIAQVLNKIKLQKPYTLKMSLFELEKVRLRKILVNWLELEKKREYFDVTHCEQRDKTKIGALEIHTQIDRVDQLADGTQIIIDYKTGKATINDWFGERPNEPQLPLYATLLQAPSGILYGQLRSEEVVFKGVLSDAASIPGGIALERLKAHDFDNFQELIAYWQVAILQLADAFCQGDAKVDPKETTTCQKCHFQSFCRNNYYNEIRYSHEDANS